MRTGKSGLWLHRAAIAACLTLCLVLALLPPALGERTTVDGAPTVTIVVAGTSITTEGDPSTTNYYVEVGLSVQTGTTVDTFRSLGAVVSYDPTLMTAIGWENTSRLTQRGVTDARESWTKYAQAMEAKGPDKLSGKTAWTYVDAGGAKGYVYLSAEAAKQMKITEMNEKLPEAGTDSETNVTTTISEDNSREDNIKVLTASATKDSSAIPVDRIDQAIVVRFSVESEDKLEDAINSVDLVTGDVAKGSPIYDEDGVIYFRGERGEDNAVKVQILRVTSGTPYYETVGGGGANPDSLAVITLFDWDDSFLGSLIVEKDQDAQTVKDEIDAFVNSEEGKSVKAALESKSSYTFSHWVPYVPGSYTAYGEKAKTLPNSTSNSGLRDVDKPTEADFGGISANMAVKAAYLIDADAVSTKLTGPTQRQYSLSVDNNTSFLKMGTSNQYSVTVTIKRLNSSTVGVQRLVKPALRVTMTGTDGSTSYQIVYLEPLDLTTATFAVDGSKVRSFVCALVDVDGVANWATGASGRSANLSILAGTSENKGFVYYGTLNFINDAISPAGTLTQINNVAILQDNLGLNTGSLTYAQARTKLRAAYNAKNGPLTIEEMQAALDAA